MPGALSTREVQRAALVRTYALPASRTCRSSTHVMYSAARHSPAPRTRRRSCPHWTASDEESSPPRTAGRHRVPTGERLAGADLRHAAQGPDALGVARAVIADQANSPSLRAVCENIGVSVRTIERAFRREVGVSFESWRRQVRLMKAIELLVGGCPVKEVAFEVGYRRTRQA